MMARSRARRGGRASRDGAARGSRRATAAASSARCARRRRAWRTLRRARQQLEERLDSLAARDRGVRPDAPERVGVGAQLDAHLVADDLRRARASQRAMTIADASPRGHRVARCSAATRLRRRSNAARPWRRCAGVDRHQRRGAAQAAIVAQRQRVSSAISAIPRSSRSSRTRRRSVPGITPRRHAASRTMVGRARHEINLTRLLVPDATLARHRAARRRRARVPRRSSPSRRRGSAAHAETAMREPAGAAATARARAVDGRAAAHRRGARRRSRRHGARRPELLDRDSAPAGFGRAERRARRQVVTVGRGICRALGCERRARRPTCRRHPARTSGLKEGDVIIAAAAAGARASRSCVRMSHASHGERHAVELEIVREKQARTVTALELVAADVAQPRRSASAPSGTSDLWIASAAIAPSAARGDRELRARHDVARGEARCAPTCDSARRR